MTIAKEFDIEYIHRKSGGTTYSTRVTVSKGSYILDQENMNGALGIAYAYISLASLSFWIYTLGNAPYVQALGNNGSGYVATQVTSEEIPSNVSQYAYRLFL